MWFDVLIAGVAIVGVYRGWKKGLLWALCSFAAILVSLWVACRYSATLSSFLIQHQYLSDKTARLVAFLFIFFLIWGIIRLGIKLLETVLESLLLGWLNRLGGAVLYGGVFLFIAGVCCHVALRSKQIGRTFQQESLLFSKLNQFAVTGLQWIKPVLPSYEEVFGEESD